MTSAPWPAGCQPAASLVSSIVLAAFEGRHALPKTRGRAYDDPEPVDEVTLAGRLIAKRRELGLSQREEARSPQIDPGPGPVGN